MMDYDIINTAVQGIAAGFGCGFVAFFIGYAISSVLRLAEI